MGHACTRIWLALPGVGCSSAKALGKSQAPLHVAVRTVLARLRGELLALQRHLSQWQEALAPLADAPTGLLPVAVAEGDVANANVASSTPDGEVEAEAEGWMEALWALHGGPAVQAEVEARVCGALVRGWTGSLALCQRRVTALLRAEFTSGAGVL